MQSNDPFASLSGEILEFIEAAFSPGFSQLSPDTEFERLALKLFRAQYEQVHSYRKLCELRGVHPDRVGTWQGIPAAPTEAFKEFDLTSIPESQRTAVFHSSGTTTHRPSRHFHHPESLAVYEASLKPWFFRHLFPEGEAPGAFDWIVLTPPAASAPNSSLVHMLDSVRREAGVSQSAFQGTAGADGWSLQFESIRQRLEQAAAAGRPVILLGTAFSFVHLLDEMSARGFRMELPEGSRVMETGGYKGRSRTLPRAGLHALIDECLGVPAPWIVCEYGMSELSSQAYDKRAGEDSPRRFNFPPWVRLLIVSPETGAPVSPGRRGILRLWDLANVRSVMTLQTGDLGVAHHDGLELAGRAAVAEPRGCSLMAV